MSYKREYFNTGLEGTIDIGIDILHTVRGMKENVQALESAPGSLPLVSALTFLATVIASEGDHSECSAILVGLIYLGMTIVRNPEVMESMYQKYSKQYGVIPISKYKKQSMDTMARVREVLDMMPPELRDSVQHIITKTSNGVESFRVDENEGIIPDEEA